MLPLKYMSKCLIRNTFAICNAEYSKGKGSISMYVKTLGSKTHDISERLTLVVYVMRYEQLQQKY